jgi:chromosome segregation ATPase
MSVEDANDLYHYIEELEQKVSILEERLEAERQSTDKYILSIEEEREAWEDLEKSLNTEVKNAEQKKWKYGFTGLLVGGLIIAVVD